MTTHPKVAESTTKMDAAIEHTKGEMATLRTGRASPALVEKLKVEVYGSDQPLQGVASVTVRDARTLEIGPWDKSNMKAIEKAIQASDLGVNPSNDGNVIRITFPELTGDRRKELVKVAKKMAEDGRVAVRNVRRHARQELEHQEKDHEISKDELDRIEKDLEKLTHDKVAEIDKLLAAKEKELLDA